MILEAKKIAFNKYIFTIEKNEIFYGKQKIRYFQQIKELYSSTDDRLIARIKTRIRLPFKVSFKITFIPENKDSFIINHVSFKKPYYSCTYQSQNHSIIPHKGLKTSIFKEGNQIAYFQKSRSNISFNDYIRLISDDDIDTTFLALIVLTLSCDFEDTTSALSFNLGNISSENKKFDTNWKPNNK